MQIAERKEFFKFMFICAIMNFLFCGGVATIKGKEDISVFLTIYFVMLNLDNFLWKFVKKLPH